jgi:hypothetical protein
MPRFPHPGMNRCELDQIFQKQGGVITHLRRTGEALYRHTSMPRPVRVNARRKDAPRHLVQYVRKVCRATVQQVKVRVRRAARGPRRRTLR